MSARTDVTSDLSDRALSRLRRECSLVASEVWVDNEHRVDFVGFRTEGVTAPYLERGAFTFCEVKSCMDDYRSGHGLCFNGDANWLVCPADMLDAVRYDTARNGKARILCPDAAGRLRVARETHWTCLRQRSALELLWAMVHESARLYWSKSDSEVGHE